MHSRPSRSSGSIWHLLRRASGEDGPKRRAPWRKAPREGPTRPDLPKNLKKFREGGPSKNQKKKILLGVYVALAEDFLLLLGVYVALAILCRPAPPSPSPASRRVSSLLLLPLPPAQLVGSHCNPMLLPPQASPPTADRSISVQCGWFSPSTYKHLLAKDRSKTASVVMSYAGR